jgi:hypothetical protein
MQQATSSTGTPATNSGKNLPTASPHSSFVINLCASTTPVGLVHPSHPQLKRFTFFVSRRREEGRERFRLHMGYFSSQEEAEKLLDLVRDIYPAAWAGVAPGQNLRSRPPAATAAAPVAARPSAPSAPAAPSAAAAPPPARTPAPVPAPASLHAAVHAAVRTDETAARSFTNVRAAIDSLRDQPAVSKVPKSPPTAAPVPAGPVPAPVPPARSEALRSAQVLRLLEGAPVARTAAPAVNIPPATPVPARAAAQLRAVPAPRPVAPALAPREPAAPPELAAYAVQLLWSVQPIDMSQIPQLAIFAAYTLYGAEGNRDGRRWYGLRLGFFTDAVSAKQVAQYVRSEFKSVSVVPVTQRERARANAAMARPLPPTAASKGTGHELNFIEDIPTDTAMSGSRPALQLEAGETAVKPSVETDATIKDAAVNEVAHNERAGTARPPARAAGGKRTKLRVAQGTKPVPKRPLHDGPLTLEETLEILGASTLQLDNGRGEVLNDPANRDRGASGGKQLRSSRFGRLMDRLAERFSGS